MKAKNGTTIIQNKFKGYFLDDIDCKYCINHISKAKGCRFFTCKFEEEKQQARKSGR